MKPPKLGWNGGKLGFKPRNQKSLPNVAQRENWPKKINLKDRGNISKMGRKKNWRNPKEPKRIKNNQQSIKNKAPFKNNSPKNNFLGVFLNPNE